MLVGREAEQARIERLLKQARQEKSGILVLRGELGIGKSVLIEDAVQRAKDMKVLRTHGVEAESELPFSGLLELLRPALDSLQHIPDRHAEALRGAMGLGPPVGADRFMIGAATLSMLAALTEERPLLVAVDDAHWLDIESAHAIAFAIRRLDADSVAVLVSLREGEGEQGAFVGLPELVLRGLDRKATGELLYLTLGHHVSSTSAERLYLLARGNPLALLELADASKAPTTPDPFPSSRSTPTTLEAAFAVRISRLSDRARRALLVAAVDEHGDLGVVVPAAQSLGSDALALEEAEAVDLITLHAGRVEFGHPLMRSAAYHRASPAERRAAHRAIAEALGPTERIRQSWHRAAGALEPDETIASALEHAANEATERQGHAAAAGALERAARLSPADQDRSRRLLAAAEAAWRAGNSDSARALADEALSFCDEVRLRADIQYLRGHIALETGRLDEARSLLEEEISRAASHDPGRAALMIAKAFEASIIHANQRDDVFQIWSTATELAYDGDPRIAFWFRLTRGWALLERLGPQDNEGRKLIHEALDLLHHERDLRADPHLLSWASFVSAFLSQYSAAKDLSHEAVALARREGAPGLLPIALSAAADYDFCTGDWSRAYAEACEGVLIGQDTGQVSESVYCLSTATMIAAARGSEDECRRRATELRSLADEAGVRFHVRDTRSLGFLEFGFGRLAEAIHHMELIADFSRDQAMYIPMVGDSFDLVEAYVRSGRTRAAASALTDLKRSSTQPYSRGALARCYGLVADDEDFDDLFLSSIGTLESLNLPFHVARSRLCYGERLRRARRRVDAREQVGDALQEFERLGAEPWAQRARNELRASGARLRRRQPESHEQLTPQESQISLLVAEGKTNKEVGAMLFLSPKTVEAHLGRIYRKLGVSSRRELPHAFPPSS